MTPTQTENKHTQSITHRGVMFIKFYHGQHGQWYCSTLSKNRNEREWQLHFGWEYMILYLWKGYFLCIAFLWRSYKLELGLAGTAHLWLWSKFILPVFSPRFLNTLVPFSQKDTLKKNPPIFFFGKNNSHSGRILLDRTHAHCMWGPY